MSCHNIGLGMNSVVDNVIQFYDERKISLVVAKKIIRSCENGVDW